MRNIELKARLDDLGQARAVARKIATEYLGIQRQLDTYYNCPRGRLKLREVDDRAAQLIWYDRTDQQAAKSSDYYIAEITDPENLKYVLKTAYGVRAVVDKQREVFLSGNVRIHLDDVAGLGRFIEFEAVLGPDADDAAGHTTLKSLCDIFSIPKSALLSGSYGEMVMESIRG